MRYHTVQTEIEIDLEDFTTEELIEEINCRNETTPIPNRCVRELYLAYTTDNKLEQQRLLDEIFWENLGQTL